MIRWLILTTAIVSTLPVLAQQPRDPSRAIGLDQKLGAMVPGEILFRDESGNTVRLRDYFGDKPIVLALVWFKCPGICIAIEDGMVDAFRRQSFQIGKDYTVLSVSIASEEGPEVAKAKQTDLVRRYGKPEGAKGWHFLTGSKDSIARLASAIGYRFVYDEKSKQYAHPAGLVVLTPEGKISHYFYGIEYRPRDLRFALVQASGGKVGTPVDQVLLACYHVDLETGKYNFALTRVLQFSGALTVLVLGASIVYMARRYRTRSANHYEEGSTRTANS